MTYPPVIVLAQEPSHISPLEIFVFLLAFRRLFGLFLVNKVIGLLVILLLNKLILDHIQAVIEHIFGTLRLNLTLAYALAHGIFGCLIILKVVDLIEVYI